MAGNDWYEKHKKDVGAAIKKGKSADKENAVSCSLVRMPDGEFLLCAHTSESKAAALVKEARAAKGKVISAGRLYQGPDGCTFEVGDGDVSVMAKMAAAAIACGVSLGGLTVVRPEEAPGAAPPVAPPAPASPAGAGQAGAPGAAPPSAPPGPAGAAAQARFTARLKDVLPALKQAQAAPGPRAEEVKLRFSEVQLFGRKQDFAQANALLDRLEGLLKAPPVPPPPPMPSAAPPPTPPPPAATAAGAAQARFTARLKDLLPALKQAQATPGPRAEEVKLRFSEAQSFVRKQDFAQANALLDRLEGLLKAPPAPPSAAPPPAPPAPSAAPAPPAPAAPGASQAAVKERLKAVRPAFQEALALARGSDPDGVAKLNGLFAQVGAEIQAKQFDKALRTVEQLESAVKTGAAGAAAKGPAAPVSNVALQRLRLLWEDARKKAQGEIVAFQQSALAKAKDDAAQAAVTEVVRRYDEAKSAFDSDLTDKLDEALNAADPDKRRDLNQQAGRMVREYQTYVGTDPLLKELQTNPFVKLTFPETLAKTLGELAANLGG